MARGVDEKSGFGDVVRTILYAILIAIGIRTFAFEPFNIPSGSMVPTLLIGDYLFVSKYAYGYSRYSMPFGIGPDLDERLFGSPPKLGDVAVFKKPPENKTDYIKRVIGQPGDRVQVTAGILHINGVPVERQRIEDYVGRAQNGSIVRAPQYIEILPNGVHHRIIEEQGDIGPADNTPEYQVPPGTYFMMGDNRDNSTDSRFLRDVGYVPLENFVGRAEFIFFSTDGSGEWWEVWKWPWMIRYSRLFSSIS